MLSFTRGDIKKNKFGQKGDEFSCGHNEFEMSIEHLEASAAQRGLGGYRMCASTQHMAGN